MTAPGQATDLPTAIALPYRNVCERRGSLEARLRNLLFTGYQALRYTGVLLLADYLDGDALEPRASRSIAGLAVPHFSGWYQLVNVLCKRVPLRSGALVEAWRRMRKDTQGITRELPSVSSSEPANPLTALWHARNRHAHGGLSYESVDPARLEAAIATLTPVLDRLIELLEPGFREISLEGMGLETTILTPSGPIPAGPLAQLHEDESDPVRLLDGFRRRAVILSGIAERTEHPELVAPLTALFATKSAAAGLRGELVEPEALLLGSRTSAVLALEELREAGHDPERRVPRVVDEELAGALADGGGAVLLRGEAGAGKTSIMALSTQTALDSGHAVLLLRGGADFEGEGSGPQRLAAALRRGFGWRPREGDDHRAVLDDVASLWDRWESPPAIHLLVDALDEAPGFGAILAAVDDLAANARQHPWLRVVVSVREGSWAALSVRDRLMNRHRALPLSHPQAWLHRREVGEGEAHGQPGIVVGGLNDAEARALYERGAQGQDLPRWERLPAETRATLCNPLLSHIGVSFSGTSLGTITGASSLFRAYIEALERRHPQLADTLLAMAEHLQHERSGELAPEWIHERLARWRAQTGQSSPADLLFFDPFELLCAASVLVPTREGSWRFGHERMFAAILARWLDHQAPQDLFGLCLRAGDEGPLGTALALHAVRLSEQGPRDPLFSLLRPVWASMGSALRAVSHATDKPRSERFGMQAMILLFYPLGFLTRVHRIFGRIALNMVVDDAGFGALVAVLHAAFRGQAPLALTQQLYEASLGDWWKSLRYMSALASTAERLVDERNLARATDALADLMVVGGSLLERSSAVGHRAPLELLGLGSRRLAQFFERAGYPDRAIELRTSTLATLGIDLSSPDPEPPRLDYEVQLVVAQYCAICDHPRRDEPAMATMRARLEGLLTSRFARSEGDLDWNDDAIDHQLTFLHAKVAEDPAWVGERLDLLVTVLQATVEARPQRASTLRKAQDFAAELDGSSAARRRYLDRLLAQEDTPTWRVLSAAKDLAGTLVEEGEEAEAIAVLRVALARREPASHEPYWEGDVLQVLGGLTGDPVMLAEAVRMFEIDRDPAESPRSVCLALDDLREALVGAGQPEEAYQAALSAARLRQGWADVHGADADVLSAWADVHHLAPNARDREAAFERIRRLSADAGDDDE